MVAQKIVPVILAGGGGSRLWPVSRESLPKQFQPLLGSLSTFQQTLQEFTDRWLDKQRFSFRDELEDLVVTFVFRWILELKLSRSEVRDVRKLYSGIFSHWAIAVTRYIPFSGFRRSLAIYRRLLERVKTSPKFSEIAGLARQEGLDDEGVLARHLCFVLGMNSFLGNQSLFKSIIGELTRLSRP